MDLLDRLLGHDAWTTRQLLLICRDLRDDELDREFPIDHGSIRALLQHMLGNMEVWTQLMRGEVVARTDRSARPTIAELLARHDAACTAFATLARSIAAAGRWEDAWTDTLDTPPTQKTYGGAIGHVITHDMHHRAHLLLMLGHLGLSNLPEGDLLGWEMHVGTGDGG